MKRIYITLILLSLLLTTAHAQFLVTKTDNTKTNVEQNVGFTRNDDGTWLAAGIPLADIASITRSFKANMKEEVFGRYYAGMKSSAYDDSANYYFCLSNTDFDINEEQQYVPSEPGGVLMIFDIYADNSEDAKNAILPEGTYTLDESRCKGTADVQSTFARVLNEQGELEYKILSSGSITVAHTDNGYKITSTLVTREGETFTVNYEGQLVFEDYSGDSTDNLMKDAVDNTVFNTLTITAHGGDADYHRYTLQLFDGNENNGVITDGVVMHIDLFSTAPDNDQIVIADGTYEASLDYTEIEKFEPFTFLAGDCYSVLGYPLYIGTYVQDLRQAEDKGILMGYVNKGTLTIKRDGEKYQVLVDVTTRNGVHITGEYPMGEVTIIDSRPVKPEGDWNSTLRDDKDMAFSEDTYAYAHRSEGYRDADWNHYDDVAEFEIVVNDHVTNESFQLNLLVPADVKSPVGKYTVADVANSKYGAYTFIPGYYDFAVMRGTWAWELFEPDGYYPISEAPATEGDIEIVENEDGTYTISYILKDDADPKHTVRAVWTGEINDPQGTWKE